MLFNGSKDMNNFSDRNLLKHLAHWYGMITLGKNKPVLMKDFDIKNMLVDACKKGDEELLFAVPFISKILLSCSKSRVSTNKINE